MKRKTCLGFHDPIGVFRRKTGYIYGIYSIRRCGAL